MKKVIFLLSFLVAFFVSNAQYPVVQFLGRDSVLVDSRGGFKARLINYPFTDTTEANTQRISQYAGAFIYTTSGGDKLWLRNSTATAWSRVGAGGGGGGITAVGTVNGVSKSTNGAVISGSTIYFQTVDGTYPGLMTSAQKARLDSNSYLTIDKTYDSLAWRRNDSTFLVKSLQLKLNGVSISPVKTDSTVSYNITPNINVRDTLSGASPSWDFSTANFAMLNVTTTSTVSVINSSDMDAGILRIIGNGTDSVILSGTSEDSLTILTGDGDITDVSFVNHGGSIYWQLVGRYTYAAPPAPATNWLTFTTATDLVETANEFTSPGGGTSFGNTGLDTAFFAAGQSGRIWHQYVDANSQACVLGFNTVNAQTGYAGMEAAVYFGTSDNLSKIDGGSAVTLGAVITYGHYVGVYRDGATGVIKLQFSSDEVIWTDQATLTYNTTAALYIVTDIQGNRQLSFPKFKRL